MVLMYNKHQHMLKHTHTHTHTRARARARTHTSPSVRSISWSLTIPCRVLNKSSVNEGVQKVNCNFNGPFPFRLFCTVALRYYLGILSLILYFKSTWNVRRQSPGSALIRQVKWPEWRACCRHQSVCTISMSTTAHLC